MIKQGKANKPTLHTSIPPTDDAGYWLLKSEKDKTLIFVLRNRDETRKTTGCFLYSSDPLAQDLKFFVIETLHHTCGARVSGDTKPSHCTTNI